MNKINFLKSMKLIIKYPKTALNYFMLQFFMRFHYLPSFHYPLSTTFFVTEKCNLKCPMCLIKETREKYIKYSQLTLENWKNVIVQLKVSKPSIYLTGGEPLLYPDLFEVIHVIKENNLICGMTTNGVLLEEYAEDIIKSNIDFISISLDGIEAVHDKSRGVKGTYQKVIKGMTKLKLLKGTNIFPNIKINCVIQSENVSEIEKLIQIASSIQIDEISFQHLSFYNEEILICCNDFKTNNKIQVNLQGMKLIKEPLPSQAILELKKIKESLPFFERKYNIKISFIPVTNSFDLYYSFKFPLNTSFCIRPWINLQIRADGTAELCDGFQLGNVKEESIYTLFNSETASRLRKILKKHKIIPYCFRCCSLKSKFK